VEEGDLPEEDCDWLRYEVPDPTSKVHDKEDVGAYGCSKGYRVESVDSVKQCCDRGFIEP